MNTIKLHGRVLSLQHRLGAFWPIIIGGVIMFGVVVMGVAAYMTIEGWPFFDSLYQVVITLSTVGFRRSTRFRSRAGGHHAADRVRRG
jgi:voltage-gated potassium channel